MVIKNLTDGVSRYESWKQHINGLIEQLQDWLEEHDLYTDEAWDTIARCLNKLEDDRLTIAFVGEFSRGKTELINTLFFSDTGRRLLPSDAGRTTMCPTEIMYDDARDEAYIRLLPIETRLTDHSVSELMKMPDEWVEFPLSTGDHGSLESSFRELANTLHVTPEEADRYGLLSEHLLNLEGRKQRYIDIPKWRHAIISYPHPLLKRGLTLLDTPGLNAIGSEPELTLTMLPAAQAAIFVLGAETGVSQTDLEIWQSHLHGHKKHKRGQLTVVLNKIDTLWDDLRSWEEIQDSIKGQILYTARTLGVSLKKIYPLSAQKGLIGLVKKDQELVEKSGIIELEDHLHHELMQSKQDIICRDVTGEIGNLVDSLKQLVHNRHEQETNQLEEMTNIHLQSDSAINSLLEKTQKQQEKYRLDSTALNEFEKAIETKSRELQELLNERELDQLIAQTTSDMEKSWTSKGIGKAIEQFSSQLKRLMDDLSRNHAENRHLIKNIYTRFQQDHGIGVIQPRPYSLDDMQQPFEDILNEAEAFSKGHRIALTGKSQIAKNFFSSIGQSAKKFFISIHHDMQHWVDSALQPLSFQIEDHRDMLNRQVQDLKLATQSRETLDQKIVELTDNIEAFDQQRTKLDEFAYQFSQFYMIDANSEY